MDPDEGPFLIYDGVCPFCSNYVRFMRLRESFPQLALLNAREHRQHPVVRSLVARGIRIDDGMVLVSGDAIHHGADAIQALAEQPQSSLFGHLSSLLFRFRTVARAVYPLLRTGRNLTLAILRRSKLGF